MTKKFKKIVVLDSVIFYPEHKRLLESMAEEICIYPTSLPEKLESQYSDNPKYFENIKCYTELGADNTPQQLLMNRLEGADCVISCWTGIPDVVLKLNPQLKLILYWTHEKEHRINLKLCQLMRIQVENIPDYGTVAVTELVFAILLQILKKNYNPGDKINRSFMILNSIFEYFRMLELNEKNTRKGKFTHHFHKLGEINFDFDLKNINQLIPEKLIRNKQIGIIASVIDHKMLNISKIFKFNINFVQKLDLKEASFHDFFISNDLVFVDSKMLQRPEMDIIENLYSSKIIPLESLKNINFNTNKTFGILGLGRIGSQVAKIASNLGFKVIYFSKTRKLHFEEENDIKFVDLENLVKMSDILSIHLPTHKADNILNKKILNEIKNGSIFINTADGNCLDQHLLTRQMLENKVLAGLDVYPGLPRKDILGLKMQSRNNWKIKANLSNHVLLYRAGWKTQELINVKTYKLLGILQNYLNLKYENSSFR